MKSFKYIIIMVLIGMNFSACDFLDTKPSDFTSPEQFFKDEKEAFYALTGIYSTLISQNVYGNTYPLLVTGTSDLAYYDRNTVPINICNNNISTSDPDVLNMWTTLYLGIKNANFFLENIEKVDMDAGLRNTYIGEARFLRAYYYFLLAQCWGDVPLVTSSMQNATENVNVPNTPQANVLKFVASEMEAAEAAVKPVQDLPNGRVSQSAVQGILARVYLKLAGWPCNLGEPMYRKALYWASKVKALGYHDLIRKGEEGRSGYEQVFVNLASDKYDTRECIWEAEFKGNRYDAHQVAGRIGNTMGIFNKDIADNSLGYCYGFLSCTLNLWDLYNDVDGDGQTDANYGEGSENERNHIDVRRDWNIAPYRFAYNQNTSMYWRRPWDYKGVNKLDDNAVEGKAATATQYTDRNIGKYRREYERVLPRNKNFTPINFPILRYSDVLLMIAEADNEVNQGPSSLAYECINTVRERAGVPKVSGKSYDSFQQLVKDERARELCFEGLRKYDLIRWGDDYMKEMNKVSRNVDDKRWSNGKKFAKNYAVNSSERYKWLPIPNKEFGLNNQLQQNPAWK